MADKDIALTIRDFLSNLFGSRLAMERQNELFRSRDDLEARIFDKEQIIAEYQARIADLQAKVDRYELIIIPLTSPLGGAFSTKRERQPFEPITDTASSWDAVQAEYYRKEAEAAAEEATKEKV